MRSFKRLLSAIFVLTLFLASCTPEAVEPNSGSNANGSSSLQESNGPHTLLDRICSPMVTYDLTTTDGNPSIPSKLGGGNWGSVTMYNGLDINQDAQFAMDFTAAPNWVMSEITYYFGKGGQLDVNSQGEPQVNANFVVAPVNPLVNATQIRVALNGLPDVNVVAAQVTVGQIDFLNPGAGLIPSTVNQVWIYDHTHQGDGTGRPDPGFFEIDWVTASCK